MFFIREKRGYVFDINNFVQLLHLLADLFQYLQ